MIKTNVLSSSYNVIFIMCHLSFQPLNKKYILRRAGGEYFLVHFLLFDILRHSYFQKNWQPWHPPLRRNLKDEPFCTKLKRFSSIYFQFLWYVNPHIFWQKMVPNLKCQDQYSNIDSYEFGMSQLELPRHIEKVYFFIQDCLYLLRNGNHYWHYFQLYFGISCLFQV